MKAFILAAGLGTRLKPLTDDRPKALVEVAGKPLINHVVESVMRAGISELVVNVHHFADRLIQHILNWEYPGLTVHISDESDELMDTGGGILKARSFLDDGQPFLVHNVDIISDIDLGAMAREHLATEALATLATRQRETTRSLMITPDGRLCGWKNRISGETKICFESIFSEVAFSGIHIIGPEFWGAVPWGRRPLSIIDIYLQLASEGKQIQSFPHQSGFWLDLGRIEQIAEAEKLLVGMGSQPR